MIHFYSRSLTDDNHLYMQDDATGEFYWMDHCWTGLGSWCWRDCPVPDIVEITEERAMEISKGTVYSAKMYKRNSDL